MRVFWGLDFTGRGLWDRRLHFNCLTKLAPVKAVLFQTLEGLTRIAGAMGAGGGHGAAVSSPSAANKPGVLAVEKGSLRAALLCQAFLGAVRPLQPP